MKVLAMPQRRYGPAWCWFTGVTQIRSITIQQLPTTLTTGIIFPLPRGATTPALILKKISFFLLGNGLMKTPLGPNFGAGMYPKENLSSPHIASCELFCICEMLRPDLTTLWTVSAFWCRPREQRKILFYFNGNLGSAYENGRPEAT